MQYMLMFHLPPHFHDYTEDDPAAAEYWESWRAYMTTVYEAGVVRSGHALAAPSTATTVRDRDHQRQVHDGPYAETKELLAGYLVIDVPDLDEALRWAERAPSSATGSTEVRPIRALGAR